MPPTAAATPQFIPSEQQKRQFLEQKMRMQMVQFPGQQGGYMPQQM